MPNKITKYFSNFTPVIEISDIRVSNYIRHKGQPVRLTHDILKSADPHDFTPIPITTRYLSLLGFDLGGGKVYLARGDVRVWCYEVPMGWRITTGETWGRVIHYIHQLQNIWYALFEEELFRKKKENRRWWDRG